MTCPHCKAPNEPGAEVCFTCGRAFQALTQGAVVSNRYEVQSLLGRGGMGAVYRAHDRVLDETVALKVLRIDFADDEGLQKRFLQEIKLARKITHRNVCRIHEYGEDNGLRYISMAYVDGVDLKRLLRNGPLPMEEAFDAMVQVAEGLAAIHDEGVLHRDLKTPNLLRDTKGVVRLLDFGIAKEWQAPTEQGITGTGLLIGTPEYMSPEQILGRKLDARSDLYSLGVVIYEVFTGQLPFKADSRVSLLQQHVSQPAPLQGPEAARLPRPLIPVLRRVLSKEPPLRFANALELADALREAWAETRSTLPVARRRDPEDEVATSLGDAMGSAETPRAPGTAIDPRTGTTVAGGATRTSITDPGRRATQRPRSATSPSLRMPRPSIPEIEDDPPRTPWGWILGGFAAVGLVIWMWPRPTPPPVEPPAPTATPVAEAAATAAPVQDPARDMFVVPAQDTAAPPSGAEERAPEPPPLAAAAPTEEVRDAATSARDECSRGAMTSCVTLADMYSKGQGVRQDTDRAVSLYEKACDRDLAQACESLAFLYLHGQGVSRDPARATSFFKRACSGGETQSCRMLDDMAQRGPGGRGGQGGPGGPGGGGPPGGGGGPPPGGPR
jgi:serine/threonine protein kinase